MKHAFALVVLTLLQLCRGETQPEWFAANLVNESNYTPKPITEIFTSDSPFTSKNPALFTQPTTSTTSTLPPTPNPTIPQNVNPPSQNGGSPAKATPEIMSQVVENQPNNELPNFLIVFDPRGQVNPIQSPVVPSSPPTSLQTQATAAQSQPTSVTSVTLQSTTQLPPTKGTLKPLQPGNPPQIINTSQPTFQSASPQPTLSISPAPWPLSSVFVYPIQYAGVNPGVKSTALPVTTTAVPTLAPVPVPGNTPKSKPVLTVRVKAPQGSITNIHINPTSTVRPTTTRRRKSTRRTNNYESCMHACNGKKEPICGSPVGQHPINPDKLKGFPSICHMACHNSFKKEQVYEKVTDGRCGRLRTRIRPVDKKKLNREELNKAQYTIVHNVPDTVVEFSPVRQ